MNMGASTKQNTVSKEKSRVHETKEDIQFLDSRLNKNFEFMEPSEAGSARGNGDGNQGHPDVANLQVGGWVAVRQRRLASRQKKTKLCPLLGKKCPFAPDGGFSNAAKIKEDCLRHINGYQCCKCGKRFGKKYGLQRHTEANKKPCKATEFTPVHPELLVLSKQLEGATGYQSIKKIMRKYQPYVAWAQAQQGKDKKQAAGTRKRSRRQGAQDHNEPEPSDPPPASSQSSCGPYESDNMTISQSTPQPLAASECAEGGRGEASSDIYISPNNQPVAGAQENFFSPSIRTPISNNGDFGLGQAFPLDACPPSFQCNTTITTAANYPQSPDFMQLAYTGSQYMSSAAGPTTGHNHPLLETATGDLRGPELTARNPDITAIDPELLYMEPTAWPELAGSPQDTESPDDDTTGGQSTSQDLATMGSEFASDQQRGVQTSSGGVHGQDSSGEGDRSYPDTATSSNNAIYNHSYQAVTGVQGDSSAPAAGRSLMGSPINSDRDYGQNNFPIVSRTLPAPPNCDCNLQICIYAQYAPNDLAGSTTGQNLTQYHQLVDDSKMPIVHGGFTEAADSQLPIEPRILEKTPGLELDSGDKFSQLTTPEESYFRSSDEGNDWKKGVVEAMGKE